MKNAIIFGNTSFSKMVKYYIEKYTDINIVGFCVNQVYVSEPIIDNIPVIPFETIKKKYPPDKYDFFIAIGNNSMNTVREKVYNNISNKGYSILNFIHPSAVIENAFIGHGNIILENVSIGYNVKIGNGNVIWNGVTLSHEDSIGNFNYIAPACALAGRVTIKDNCFLGINCTIKNDITIKSYSLIGAGCYINKSTQEKDVFITTSTLHLSEKNSLDFCRGKSTAL